MLKTTEVPQCIDKAVDVTGLMQRQIPLVQSVQKIVEVPQIQFIDKVVDAPVNMQPAREMEHVASTLATEYIATATGVTDAVATAGVNLDITGLMNPMLSITTGEASTPHVVDSSLRKSEEFRFSPISAREGRHENSSAG